MKIIKNHLHPKISEAIMMFNADFIADGVSEFEFYMYFLNHVSFWEAELEMMPTMAATVYNNRLAILWTKEFVESLSQRELMAVLIHEAMHLLSNHIQRGKGYDQQVSNIAMDMIINHLLIKYHGQHVNLPLFTQEEYDKAVANGLPPDKLAKLKERIGKPSCVELDPNYKGDLVYEPLYNWLIEEWQKEKNGQSNQLSQGTKDMMQSAENRRGMTLDFHGDISEVEDQIRKALANNASEKAKLDYKRSRGTLPGSISDILDLLLKTPKKNNLKQLKRMVSSLKGKEKQRTYSRLNRRVEGLKGNKKQSLAVNVILDTSGSMSGEFEIALTEIFHGGYFMNLIQCDTQVNRHDKITDRKQLNKLKISGLGGTLIQPAVEYVLDPKNKLNKLPTVILSDSYTDTLDFHGGMNQWLLLSTTGNQIPYTNGKNVRSLSIEK
jgi:predicted metal-dependent peptidase